MSKRWKVRQRNAARREKSREVIDQFYGNVIAELERMAANLSKPEAEPMHPELSRGDYRPD